MNTSGNATAQQCTGPSSWATERNWDQNNSAVTALEPRVHYHHNNSNNNNNNSSSSSTTSSSSHTANRVGWEWDQSTMLMSHERNHGQGIGTDPGKEAAALINSGIRSSFLDGLFPYGHPHMAPLFPANTSLRSCFPSVQSHSGIHLLGGMGDVVKQESVHGGFSRIGLSLGGTYFSSDDGGVGLGRLMKRARGNTPGSQVAMCQAEGCRADLSSAKHYHRRHKVCEQHSKAAIVLTGGQNQRFCQQCSRFHLLSEFDDGKRSCRKRLADHNRRRRKPQSNINNDVTRSANGEPTASSKEDLQESSTNNQSTGTQANSMSGSDSQALTPAISLAPPVSLMIQNTITTNNNDNHHHSRRQMPMVSGSTEDPIYHYIHVTNPQTGPNLSLSSSLVGIPVEEYQWRQQVPQGSKKYECNEQSSVPWLRHQGSELVSPSPLNLQPPSVLRTKSSENSATSNSSSSQVFSSIQSSRSGLSSSANWVMSTGTIQRNHGGKDHGHCNTHFGVVSGINVAGNLEGQQVLSLLECSSTFRDDEGTARQQQTSSSETESTSTGTGTGSGTGTGQQQGGDHVKFQLPDLHALRPFTASPSLYDANTSLL